MTEITTRTSTPNFSAAFKQMASFVAIAKTKVETHVLDELIKQCYVILPSEPLNDPEEIRSAISTVFGLQINYKDVAIALDRLKKDGHVQELVNGQLCLRPESTKALSDRIEGARALEKRVRDEWIAEVYNRSPQLDAAKLWCILQEYLSMAFRRHGILAVELLDPEVRIAQDTSGSLSAALNKAISKHFSGEDAIQTREAMEAFFISVGANRARAEYISSLADAAFNYYSLAVAPEVSERLRGNLSKLTLFLDTNFLFGLLKLHVNSQVDVSAELVQSIKRFKLPFRLRYHEVTIREVSNTLHHFKEALRKKNWNQGISRAIVSSGALSGVELGYHTRNASTPVTVDDFFAPFEHWRILLKDTSIDVYNVTSNADQLLNRATLEAEYTEYLKGVNREKPIDAIQHDMAILDTVRSLRSKARNTLEAGSLLVTCDYHLFKFDFEQSRQARAPHSTVLPSLLWQILRPFVSDHSEFDKAFAETFALPEFSLTRGGAKKAAARMASILAGYRDIPEETAVKMLTNDALIAELQTKRTDQEFEATVESALAKENAQLSEEKAALEKQLESAAQSQQRAAQNANATIKVHETTIADQERVLAERHETIQAKDRTIDDLTAAKTEKEKTANDALAKAAKSKEDLEKAQNAAAGLEKLLATERSRGERKAKQTGILVGALAVLVFELIICRVYPVTWILEHPNSYGLQVGVSIMIFCGILGAWVKPWRTWCWTVGAFGLLVAVIPMLGGPKQQALPEQDQSSNHASVVPS